MDELWNWPGETAACIMVGVMVVILFVAWWGWVNGRVSGTP